MKLGEWRTPFSRGASSPLWAEGVVTNVVFFSDGSHWPTWEGEVPNAHPVPTQSLKPVCPNDLKSTAFRRESTAAFLAASRTATVLARHRSQSASPAGTVVRANSRGDG